MEDLRRKPRRQLLCTEPLEGRWLLSALTLSPLPAPAQLPAEIAAALESRYPGAKVVSAELTTDDADREYDITADYQGRTLAATFDPAGQLLESEMSAPPAAAEPGPPPAPDPVQVVEVAPAEVQDNDTPLPSAQLPVPVETALQAMYPGAKVIEAEASGDGDKPEVGLRADFGGGVIDVAFTPGGDFIESQVALETDDLPLAALAWVRRHYPGATIDDAQVVTNAGVVTYEMTIAGPGQTPVEASLHLAPNQPTDRPAADVLPSGNVSQPRARVIVTQWSDGSRVPEPRAFSRQGRAPSLVDGAAAQNGTHPGRAEGESMRGADGAAGAAGESATHAADIATAPASLAAAAFKAVIAGAAQALPPIQLAGPRDLLPLDLAGVQRGLKDLLQQLDAIAARPSSGITVAGVAGGAGALVALLAAAHLLLGDARKTRNGPMVVFGAFDPSPLSRRGRAAWDHP